MSYELMRLFLFKIPFFPRAAIQTNAVPVRSMKAGSEILEKEKETPDVGLTEIVDNTAIDIPANNNFVIPPPIAQSVLLYLNKDGIFVKAVALNFSTIDHLGIISH